MTKKTRYEIKEEIRFMVVKESLDKEIHSARDVYSLMKTEARIDRECVWVLHLNSRKKLIEKELVSMGTAEESLMRPREVFRKAIINGAVSIIIVHNHPSGNVTPSDADIFVSEDIKKAGEMLGVPVDDFIIIGNEYTSFADQGIGEF
ncbi:MAG: JAB domain-containing protein [Halanaerobiales bacterium]|nr:JAB domain-containing protein [Halanaerobiales bacterium]